MYIYPCIDLVGPNRSNRRGGSTWAGCHGDDGSCVPDSSALSGL